MIEMKRLLVRTSCVALAIAMIPEAAVAQTADAPSEADNTNSAASAADIVVTARKRAETVRDVPTTITAQLGEQLEAKGPIQGAGDLLAQVPGVRFNGVQSENLAEVSIRGSGTQRATSADSGIGLFVNGAYVGSSTLGGRNFKRIDYFDLARVEVLEGPQGALYGRNSEFGTVNVVLAEPVFRDTGKVSATYTDELGQMRLEGVINKELSDKIAVRFGGQVTGQSNGQFYNPNRNEYYDHTDGWIARGQIRYADGPLDIKLLVDAMDMNLPSFANQWVLQPGQLAAIPQGYVGPRYDVPSDIDNYLHQQVQRAMLIAEYDLGWAKLTSTSMASRSISEQGFPAAIDLATQAMFQSLGEIGLYPLGRTATYARNKTLYQDIHLAGDADGGRLSWLAGVEGLMQNDLYRRETATSPCPLTLNSSICGGTPTQPICYQLTAASRPCPATFPLPFGTLQRMPSKYRSGAIYGSLKYDIGSLSLSGELRYSHDYKKAEQSTYLLYTSTLTGRPSSFTFKQGNLSYSATASYKLVAPLPVLFYAKTGTGYRAGGVNNGTYNENAPNPLRETYGNETTTSYELGLKADLARRMFLRLSAYTSRTKDAITSLLDGCTVTNACGQTGTYFNVNGGTVRVRGAEAAFDASVPVGVGMLVIGLNGARQSAKFVDVTQGVAGLPIVGSMVAQTPKWTMSANVNLRHPLTDDLTGFANVAYNGQRGGGQDTVTLATPFTPLVDIDNVDMRAGLEYKGMEFAFFVKNLTNQVVPVLILKSGTVPLTNRFTRPRTTGFSATFKW
jgi:iron complex outermembrane receptor protein